MKSSFNRFNRISFIFIFIRCFKNLSRVDVVPKRGREEKDFANVLKIKLNHSVKCREIDGPLCCWAEISRKMR